LELGYRQFSAIVSEIPAFFEYIDFRGPPDGIQIAKIGGYPVGPGMASGTEGDRISHNMAVYGNTAQSMEYASAEPPHTRPPLTPRAPFAAPIRRLETPAQMHVLKNCAYRQKYRQKLTACRLGYPRGYILELS
ncbi:MAG TPA: hypothetical protein PLM74_10545, partial [Bacillota bacterium]|nr:hypothetical protein [Bacillota bacterium]